MPRGVAHGKPSRRVASGGSFDVLPPEPLSAGGRGAAAPSAPAAAGAKKPVRRVHLLSRTVPARAGGGAGGVTLGKGESLRRADTCSFASSDDEQGDGRPATADARYDAPETEARVADWWPSSVANGGETDESDAGRSGSLRALKTVEDARMYEIPDAEAAAQPAARGSPRDAPAPADAPHPLDDEPPLVQVDLPADFFKTTLPSLFSVARSADPGESPAAFDKPELDLRAAERVNEDLASLRSAIRFDYRARDTVTLTRSFVEKIVNADMIERLSSAEGYHQVVVGQAKEWLASCLYVTAVDDDGRPAAATIEAPEITFKLKRGPNGPDAGSARRGSASASSRASSVGLTPSLLGRVMAELRGPQPQQQQQQQQQTGTVTFTKTEIERIRNPETLSALSQVPGTSAEAPAAAAAAAAAEGDPLFITAVSVDARGLPQAATIARRGAAITYAVADGDGGDDDDGWDVQSVSAASHCSAASSRNPCRPSSVSGTAVGHCSPAVRQASQTPSEARQSPGSVASNAPPYSECGSNPASVRRRAAKPPSYMQTTASTATKQRAKDGQAPPAPAECLLPGPGQRAVLPTAARPIPSSPGPSVSGGSDRRPAEAKAKGGGAAVPVTARRVLTAEQEARVAEIVADDRFDDPEPAPGEGYLPAAADVDASVRIARALAALRKWPNPPSLQAQRQQQQQQPHLQQQQNIQQQQEQQEQRPKEDADSVRARKEADDAFWLNAGTADAAAGPNDGQFSGSGRQQSKRHAKLSAAEAACDDADEQRRVALVERAKETALQRQTRDQVDYLEECRDERRRRAELQRVNDALSALHQQAADEEQGVAFAIGAGEMTLRKAEPRIAEAALQALLRAAAEEQGAALLPPDLEGDSSDDESYRKRKVHRDAVVARIQRRRLLSELGTDYEQEGVPIDLHPLLSCAAGGCDDEPLDPAALFAERRGQEKCAPAAAADGASDSSSSSSPEDEVPPAEQPALQLVDASAVSTAACGQLSDGQPAQAKPPGSSAPSDFARTPPVSATGGTTPPAAAAQSAPVASNTSSCGGAADEATPGTDSLHFSHCETPVSPCAGESPSMASSVVARGGSAAGGVDVDGGHRAAPPAAAAAEDVEMGGETAGGDILFIDADCGACRPAGREPRLSLPAAFDAVAKKETTADRRLFLSGNWDMLLPRDNASGDLQRAGSRVTTPLNA
ncbi:hypothetical protein DIPPA_28403 [Diplonema papillatum]|nr:hypothetical protein DIPPA_28403 [Diplonema papillatum]